VATASAVAVGSPPFVSVRAVVSGKVHDDRTGRFSNGALLSARGSNPTVTFASLRHPDLPSTAHPEPSRRRALVGYGGAL
jgi:hypothetical protein